MIRFDSHKPDAARVHDVLLDGHDNFAANREQAEELIRICPGSRDVVRGDREFLIRAVTWAAGQGIRQFAECGALAHRTTAATFTGAASPY